MVRLVVLVALVGCAARPTPGTPHLHSPTAGIPLTGYVFEFARCESPVVQPATLCVRGTVSDYDGCEWRCVPAPIEGARQ